MAGTGTSAARGSRHGAAMRARLAADRLYAISLRPQEWDAHRERAQLTLRYGPMAEGDEPLARHWTLLVVEARVRLPGDDPLAAGHPDGLEVCRVGWEAELELPVALPPAALEEDPGEVPALLAKAAELVNACAARAGIEPLLTAELVAALAARRG